MSISISIGSPTEEILSKFTIETILPGNDYDKLFCICLLLQNKTQRFLSYSKIRHKDFYHIAK